MGDQGQEEWLAPSGPPEAEIRRLVARLNADEFSARELATQELIEKARGRRDLIHEAARSQSLEMRMRAERVLASWDPHYAERLNAYLSGFWTYLEGISDPKRLRKVATACEDFGYRKQLSVFLCRLSATDYVRLRSRLYDVIELKSDQVLFIPLCKRCAGLTEALGRPVVAHDARDVVIVS